MIGVTLPPTVGDAPRVGHGCRNRGGVRGTSAPPDRPGHAQPLDFLRCEGGRSIAPDRNLYVSASTLQGESEMKIRIQGEPGQRLPRTLVATRLAHALGHLPFESLSTAVTFSDVNGPKGGNDICCALVVDLPHQPAIRVEGRGPTPTLAFDVGYDRLVRRLERSRERWRNQRRHPKKYFAAARAQ